MLFERMKTKLILDETELDILTDAYEVLSRLVDEMYDNNFTSITIGDWTINNAELGDTIQNLRLLINGEKLEVE